MKKHGLSVLGASCLACSSVAAYEKVDPYSLSLESLLDTKVVSASRKEEEQHLASGVMTVVSAQEIKQFGARHLRDVLDRLVGIMVIGSHQNFHAKTSVRASNASHHEESVLVLLNGRPMRQATGLNSDLYIGFPLKSIERIEVIRGPGSVIYGTNAMAGVINIITYDGKSSTNKTELELGAGSFGTVKAQVNTVQGDKDYSFNLNYSHISADGDPVPNLTDQDGNPGTYETGVGNNSLFINGRYKNFTLNALAMRDKQDSASSAFQFPAVPIESERYFLDVGYLYDLATNWDASLNYTYNEDNEHWQINEAAGNNNAHGQSHMVETIVRGKLNAHSNLLLGANHVEYESGFDRGLPPNSTNASTSAYLQLDYMTTDKQKLIAGLQWNKPKRTESDMSPRLGIIQGFGKNWWVKFLYSEAYRSPNLVETSLDAPQLKGVPTLNPENISTYDAQLIYKTPTTYFSAALYHSKLENLVVRVPGMPTTHANEGYVKFKGIELEGKIELSSMLSLVGNLSYQENKSDSGVKNGTFAPQVMAKFGGSYDNDNGLMVTVFHSYIGDSTDLSQTNVAPALNPKADAYHLLTANISIDTGRMWGLGKPKHSTLSLYLDNLLDAEVYAPDLNFANRNNTIPHHWGRGAYVFYNYRF